MRLAGPTSVMVVAHVEAKGQETPCLVTGGSVPGWEGTWVGSGPFLISVMTFTMCLTTLDTHPFFLAGTFPSIVTL